MFRTILGSCAAAAVAFGATAAAAAPLTFDFTIDLIAAPDGTGSFTIDDATLTGSGLEIFAPNSGNTLISFTAMVGGLTYTAADDPSFDEFPQVSFLDGVVTSMSYSAEIGDQCLSIGAGSGLGVFFGDLSAAPQIECAEPGLTSGEITNITPGTPSPIPSPATGLLLATGIGVLGVWRRRRA